MKDLKKNPEVTKLQERGSKSLIMLSGFVGNSPEGVVRLFQGTDISQSIDIPESSIDEFEQDTDSGMTHLYVKSNAIIEVVSTRKVPISIVFTDDKPDGGVEKTCLDKRIDNCKNDPLVHDKSFCTSNSGKHVFKTLCDLLGDPPEEPEEDDIGRLIGRLINLLANNTNKINSIR